jgi:predicted ArsR family transcriptional regulator
VETTRQTILEILRRRKQATIEELTRALGLAPATIRRHLDILMRDSLVSVGQVRRETGRPHYVFSLTEAGEDVFPKSYIRLTNRLIEEIVGLDAAETRGRDGIELAGLVFEKMAERMALTYAPRITGVTLEERLEQVVNLLAGEGIARVARKGATTSCWGTAARAVAWPTHIPRSAPTTSASWPLFCALTWSP